MLVSLFNAVKVESVPLNPSEVYLEVGGRFLSAGGCARIPEWSNSLSWQQAR
jgi:hypothetical protein